MSFTVLCEFGSADALVAAASRLGELGFGRMEAYTPYAISELESLLHVRRSQIPWAALAGGASGVIFAFVVIWYCNAYDYPLDVGGRPINSIPSDIPIAFETAVLFAALTTFALALVRSGLPRLHNPLFEIDGFDRVSVDRYWLGIDLGDRDGSALDLALRDLGAQRIHHRRRAP